MFPLDEAGARILHAGPGAAYRGVKLTSGKPPSSSASV
jgi:hypothetical protein